MNVFSNRRAGFTIIEIIVVIVVLAILATLAVFGYNVFSRQTREASLETNLSAMAANLASDKKETGDFPSALGDFNDGAGPLGSEEYDYVYTSNAQNFCLIGTSKTDSSVVFSITQTGEVVDGSCTLAAVTETDDEGLYAGGGGGGGGSTTSEACFTFSGGTIENYLDYENNNPANPACPRDVVIPSTIGGVPVVVISTGAFDNWASIESKKLTSLVLPSSIEQILAESFMGNKLTTVVIPSGATEVAGYAFAYNDLTSITLPNTLTDIYAAAFIENNLTAVSVYSGTYLHDAEDAIFGSGVTVTYY